MNTNDQDREARLLRQLSDPRARLRGMAEPGLAARRPVRPQAQPKVTFSPALAYLLSSGKFYL